MIVVYQFATSPFCEKVRRILNFKGVDFRIEEVERAKVAELQHISPRGKFPAIVHDGVAVWDSTRIAHYVEAAFPEPRLIPADAQAAGLVHILEDWADESLYFYEVTMRLSWEQNIDRSLPEFLATMPGASAEDVRARMLERTRAGSITQGIGRKSQDEVVEDVERHFAAIGRLIAGSGWLVGAELTLADIAVASQVGALLYAREAEALMASMPDVAAWKTAVDRLAPP